MVVELFVKNTEIGKGLTNSDYHSNLRGIRPGSNQYDN